MTDRAEIAKKALDYWYSLEFLTQETFPDYRKTKREADSQTFFAKPKLSDSKKQRSSYVLNQNGAM